MSHWCSIPRQATIGYSYFCKLLRVCAIFTIAIGGGTVCCAQDGSAEARKLTPVISDWEHRYTFARSVHYKLEGTDFHSLGSYNEPGSPNTKKQYPASDTSHIYKGALQLDFEHQCLGKWAEFYIWYHDDKMFIPRYWGFLFDGDMFHLVDPRERNTSDLHVPAKLQPDVAILSPDPNLVYIDIADWPLYLAHGLFDLPSNLPKQKKFDTDLTSKNFELLSPIPNDIVTVLLIRSRPNLNPNYYNDYLVDPKKAHAIIRASSYTANGDLLVRCDISHQLVEGAWLPAKWVTNQFNLGSNGRLNHSRQRTVTSIELNAPFSKASFQPKLEPNMIVLDDRIVKRYKVDADGKTLIPLDPNWQYGGVLVQPDLEKRYRPVSG